ncbi:MAG TPA: hypothetical protein VGG84_15300 [Gemmatimonadaceae bacterium]
MVDGEAGFGVAPLRAHLQECGECRERVEEARVVADALEALPHFAPDARLADRVMAQVPVFVPAHVAARDAVQRWVPRSAVARVAVASLAATVGGALTGALVWLAMRGDAVLFMSDLLSSRFRGVIVDAARDLAVTLFGESVLTALQATGAVGVSLLLGGFLLTAIGTIAGIRRLAAAGRRA